MVIDLKVTADLIKNCPYLQCKDCAIATAVNAMLKEGLYCIVETYFFSICKEGVTLIS